MITLGLYCFTWVSNQVEQSRFCDQGFKLERFRFLHGIDIDLEKNPILHNTEWKVPMPTNNNKINQWDNWKFEFGFFRIAIQFLNSMIL